MTENDKIIESMVSDACISLFEDYALPLRRADIASCGDASELLYAAVIGFSGDQMRGSLLLATSSAALGRTSPTTGAPLREWIAELSNQLIGRIKNKLIERGVTLHLSTPAILKGKHLAPLSRRALTA